MKNLTRLKEYIFANVTYFKEAYTWKDKFILIKHYVKTPIFLLNYLRGIPNSPLLPGEIFIKNKYGVFFCGKNKYCLTGFSSYNEREVRKEMNLNEGVAIDIGANGGMYTIPLAKRLEKTGRVIAVEPEPRNVEILRRNLRLNKIKNVDLISKACFSKKGKMKFYLDDFDGSGTHSLIKKQSQEMIVDTDTLDNILKDLDIRGVNLIQIDVEGAEADVLKGATKTLRKYHPKIIFEAWDGNYLQKCKEVLEPFGYKIQQISSENYLAR